MSKIVIKDINLIDETKITLSEDNIYIKLNDSEGTKRTFNLIRKVVCKL